jgi:hypothetical protein
VGAWLGTVLLVSWVAYTVFGTLPRDTAGDVMTRVFSGYYWMGIGLGVLALGSAIALARRTGWTWERWGAVVLLCAMIAAAGYTRLILTPDLVAARTARDAAADPAAAAPLQAEFDKLHQRSRMITVVLLAGAAGVILLEAAREQRKEHDHDAA